MLRQQSYTASSRVRASSSPGAAPRPATPDDVAREMKFRPASDLGEDAASAGPYSLGGRGGGDDDDDDLDDDVDSVGMYVASAGPDGGADPGAAGAPPFRRGPSSVRSEPPPVLQRGHTLPAYVGGGGGGGPGSSASRAADGATNETLTGLFVLARDVKELADADRGRVRGSEELALRAREVRSVLDEYRDFVHLHAFSPLVQRALATIRHALLGAKETLRRALQQKFRRNAKYKEAVQMCLNNLQQALTRLGHALSLSQQPGGGGGAAASVSGFDDAASYGGPPAGPAAEPGEAQCLEGDRLALGHGRAQSWSRALAQYRQAARLGSTRGMLSLGRLLRAGRGAARDFGGARRWLERAAEAGCGDAAHELGRMAAAGEGCRADEEEAARQYARAAEAGSADGAFALGRVLERAENDADGSGLEEALALYAQAARQGHAASQNRVGYLWSTGAAAPDGRADHVEACRWFRMAADGGCAEALYNLGVCAEAGQGVPRAEGEALELFRRAAAEGHANAAAGAGYLLLRRGEYGAAVESLRKAAEGGSAEGAHYLGVAYERGHAVPPCRRTAFDYFSRAAAAGHARARVRAADCLFGGAGAPRDPEAAFALYKLAADQGLPEAANSLGVMLEAGEGAIQSYEEAAYWYRRAAAGGHADAVYNLGSLVERGLGAERDERLAEELYREASRGGSLAARARLERSKVRREGPPPSALALAVREEGRRRLL